MNLRHLAEFPEGRARLAAAVRSRLREILNNIEDMVPDELVEYVVVLLTHGKSQEEITATLLDFLQDAAQPFTAWLFEHIEENQSLYVQQEKQILERTGSRAKRNWQSTQETAQPSASKETTEPGTENGKEGTMDVTAKEIAIQGCGGVDIVKQGGGETQGRSKRSRKHSPIRGEWDEQGRLKRDRRSINGAGDDQQMTSASARHNEPEGKMEEENGVDHWEDRPEIGRTSRNRKLPAAHRRLFATALGAVTAQFDDKKGSKDQSNPARKRTETRPKRTVASVIGAVLADNGHARGSTDSPRKSKHRTRREDGGHGEKRGSHKSHSVFARLGNVSSGQVQKVKGDRGGKAKGSVFDRLNTGSGKSKVMNMQFTMDVQTREGPSSQDANAQSSTFTVTVNHSTQPTVPAKEEPVPLQKSPPIESKPEPKPGKQTGKDAQPKLSEIELLRQKVAKMEQDLASMRNKGKPKQEPVVSQADKCAVCVQNVHFAATREVAVAHFAGCGQISNITFPLDPFGHPQGYCFVDFADEAGAKKALLLGGSVLMGRMIKVIPKSSFQMNGGIQRSMSMGRRGGVPYRMQYSRGWGGRGWGGRGVLWARGSSANQRGSLKLVRKPSDGSSVQDAGISSSAAVEESTGLVANPIDQIEPKEDEGEEVHDVGQEVVNCPEEDVDFEIDTGAQHDDVHNLLEEEAL